MVTASILTKCEGGVRDVWAVKYPDMLFPRVPNVGDMVCVRDEARSDKQSQCYLNYIVTKVWFLVSTEGCQVRLYVRSA